MRMAAVFISQPSLGMSESPMPGRSGAMTLNLCLSLSIRGRHIREVCVYEYVNYYHDDRIHDSLAKDTPHRRPVESKPSPTATVISNPRLGGLRHRYGWREAA